MGKGGRIEEPDLLGENVFAVICMNEIANYITISRFCPLIVEIEWVYYWSNVLF